MNIGPELYTEATINARVTAYRNALMPAPWGAEAGVLPAIEGKPRIVSYGHIAVVPEVDLASSAAIAIEAMPAHPAGHSEVQGQRY